MNLADLNAVARAMVAPGKGLLAADESRPTIRKRFDAIGVVPPKTAAAITARCCFAAPMRWTRDLRRHPV